MIDNALLFPYIITAYGSALFGCTALGLRIWLRFRTAQKQWQEWQQLTHNTALSPTLHKSDCRKL